MATKYIIYATSKKTNIKQAVSLGVTKDEIIPYLDQEFTLSKKYPSDKGLYGEFKNVHIKRLKS